jgi:RNA polymerase sigma factor (sigma-70 family)
MAGPDTSMGGGLREFPPTPGFVKPDPGQPLWSGAFEELSRLYWKPVYLFLRTVGRLSNDDAKDQAQQFFLQLLRNRALERYRPEVAPFRVFLKSCLRNFLVDEVRRRAARPGVEVPLEAVPDPAAEEAGREFDREWLRSVLEAAVAGLQAELALAGRSVEWELFQDYDLRDPERPRATYAELGAPHGLSEAEVRNALAYVRGKLRERAVAEVRRSVGDPAGLRSELGQMGLL